MSAGEGEWRRALAGIARPIASKLERAWVEAWSHPEVSGMTARIADMALPRPVLERLIVAFARAYLVDLAEAALPVAAYRTFNAFFTRELAPGSRPVAADGALVSPADAVVTAFGTIDPRGRIPEVKGRRFSVATLLGDPVAAEALVGGRYAILYLSPRDYHRVHSPVDARLAGLTRLDGRRYPVNALGVRVVRELLATNIRCVFSLDAGAELGRVIAVMVGATNVGRITTNLTAGDHVARGEELGVFNLGSTVVLLTEAPDLDLARVAVGDHVKMGTTLLERG